MFKIIGASAVLSCGDKYIFEIQKEHKWKHSPTGIEIGISCIGGSVEGDESPAETLQREALEEIQTEVSILNWESPFIITDEFQVEDCSEGERIDNLFFYWQGTRKPYHNRRVCVFLAEVLKRPSPDDLPGILICDIELLLECFRENLTLGQSLERGVMLTSRKGIPLEAEIKPVGTAAMLQELYLNHQNRIGHLLN